MQIVLEAFISLLSIFSFLYFFSGGGGEGGWVAGGLSSYKSFC